jgi:ribosomal protein S18 acetylase RimI-like enzyme
MARPEITILPFSGVYRQWAANLLEREWGSTLVVSRGRLHDALALAGFVAEMDGSPVGLATYRLEGSQCELVTINSLRPGAGIGTALLLAVSRTAREEGCLRLWLITTNDNLEAMGFYQRRGLELVAVHRNALEETRRLKPQLPLIGRHGIPLRDELELELRLTGEQQCAR